MNSNQLVGVQLRTGFKGLSLPATVGVYAEEKGSPQELIISLSIGYSSRRIRVLYGSDLIDAAHDYTQAADIVRQICMARHHELLENLALDVLKNLRTAFPDCDSLDLEIEKPQAMPNAACSFCQLSWTTRDSEHFGLSTFPRTAIMPKHT